ncbi:MAG: helix-turn-helix domain-containing protein [Candidatus Obscuribacter sp.]|nr:helix-turn-helix domain-containing protein [Candidatus Obscuribacter sp.]
MSNKDELLTPIEAAQLLKLDLSTLAAWRCQRKGIPYVKVGTAVRYRRGAVEAYLAENETFPIREAKK